jgi:hypothetical protein
MAKQNTHLEHLEDDILNQGSNGGRNAIAFLRELGKMLTEPVSGVGVTTKWDGAPAVICGKHPTTGRFFVGTKGVFAKMPKICMNDEDVDRFYSGELANKLKMCLRLLPQVPMKGVLQGDLLFTKGDVSTRKMNGQKCHTFMPNTITYAVPVDSDIGKRIAKARMGIVFHTSYSGKTMDSLSASFGTVRGAGNRNVFLASAGYKETAVMFNKRELSRFDAQIRMAEGSLSKAAPILDLMSKTSSDQLSVGFRLKTYFNYFIKNSNSGMGKVATMQEQFRDYFNNILQAEIDAKKTPRGKERFIRAQKDGLRFIDRNKRALYFAIASHITLGTCKNTLLQKMNQIQSIGNFMRTSKGYRVTAPEGYVAVDKVAGAVKLVDRLEFSRQNFTMPKGWN